MWLSNVFLKFKLKWSQGWRIYMGLWCMVNWVEMMMHDDVPHALMHNKDQGQGCSMNEDLVWSMNWMWDLYPHNYPIQGPYSL